MNPDIVRRYRGNPVLTKAAIPYPVETVHNAAVVKQDGKYIMLFRSHLRTSTKGTPKRPASRRPTDDLPAPIMPTSTMERRPSALTIACSAVFSAGF